MTGFWSDIDAVYVPLPNALHTEWIERALCAGKHVLAEKPLTTSLTSTARLVALAAAEGLVLAENITYPHHSQHAHVSSLVQEGAIGALRSVSAAFSIPPRDPSDIRYQPALGGGSLLDCGVYPISVARRLLGDGLEVAGASLRYEAGVDRSGSVLLRRADGATALLSFGMEHYYLSRYEVHGSEGRITVDRAFTPDGTAVPAVTVERGGAVEQAPLAADDQYKNAVTAFASLIRARPRIPDPAIVENARLLDIVRQANPLILI